MNVGIIGLGRMGSGVAQRLVQKGHTVVGYDPNSTTRTAAMKLGVSVVHSLQTLAQQTHIIFLFIPAGSIVDSVLNELLPYLRKGDIIIDGGNSNYQDSIRRSKQLFEKQMLFLDCGTSGGVHGKDIGYCLMVGGDRGAYMVAEPLFEAIAAANGCAYVGPSGAGHYVKMVHNGIEYALLQAYAEGFHLLKDGSFAAAELQLDVIARLWDQSSIIRSWILHLLDEILHEQDRDLSTIAGSIAESGTGRWTVEEGHKAGVPIDLIERALALRFESQKTGGNYATKLVALLRNKFGGHDVQKKG